jgi:hypothetical protein
MWNFVLKLDSESIKVHPGYAISRICSLGLPMKMPLSLYFSYMTIHEGL